MVLNANSWKFGKIRKLHVGVNLLVIQYSTHAKCCRQKHRRFLFKRPLNWVKLSAWNYFCWCCCLWVECMLRNEPALFEVPWQRSSCQSIVVYGKKSLFLIWRVWELSCLSRYQAASSVLSRETNAVTRAEPMRVGCIGWLVAAKFVVTCVEPRNINPTTHNIRMMNNG